MSVGNKNATVFLGGGIDESTGKGRDVRFVWMRGEGAFRSMRKSMTYMGGIQRSTAPAGTALRGVGLRAAVSEGVGEWGGNPLARSLNHYPVYIFNKLIRRSAD